MKIGNSGKLGLVVWFLFASDLCLRCLSIKSFLFPFFFLCFSISLFFFIMFNMGYTHCITTIQEGCSV